MACYGLYDIFDISDLGKEDLKEKNRNWIEIVYPESAPDDWLDRLRGLHLPMAVSPLHDKDLNETGELKKPHYHVIVSFDGPTTYKNANRAIQSITNGTIVKPCRSVRGSFRYFTHLDNPEKYQYSAEDIQQFNSFEVAMTDSDEDMLKRAIMNIVLVNRIQEYTELMLVLEYEFGFEYAKVARRNHNFISAMVNSIRHNPGASYKRFLQYITPEEFNFYAMDKNNTYEKNLGWIKETVARYNKSLDLPEEDGIDS